MHRQNATIAIPTVSVLLLLGGATSLGSCDGGRDLSAPEGTMQRPQAHSKVQDVPDHMTVAQFLLDREVKVVTDRDTMQIAGPQVVNYWAHAFNASWGQATGIAAYGWAQRAQENYPIYGGWTIYDSFIANCSAGGSGSTDYYRETGGNGINGQTAICDVYKYYSDVAIHEFGHLMGFNHEYERNDFPTLDATNCPSGVPGWGYKGTDTSFTENTLYDPFSMTNSGYCHNLIELSYEDIVGAQNAWGHPNYFADVTGDGADDAIVVNSDGVYVIVNNNVPCYNFTAAPAFWGGYKGARGTFFADVNGDRKADMIAIDLSSIKVSLANSAGTGFSSPAKWTIGPTYGRRGMYVADMNGDGKADVIANTSVDFNYASNPMLIGSSTGTRFAYWNHPRIDMPAATVGSRGFFADVTGPDADGKSRADYIYYDTGGVWVNKNSSSGFKGGTLWLSETFGGTSQNPPLPLLFADIDGDGKADYIATYPSAYATAAQPTLEGIAVYPSTGSGFSSTPSLRSDPVAIPRGIFAAKLSKTGNSRSVGWVDQRAIWSYDSQSGGYCNLTGGQAFYATGAAPAAFFRKSTDRTGGSGGSWDSSSYNMATCADNEAVIGLSMPTSYGYSHAAYCMKRSDVSLAYAGILAPAGEQHRGNHFPSDWDPYQWKMECGISEFVSGVSQSTDGKLHGIRCSSGLDPGVFSGTACETRDISYGAGYSGDYGDWDPGYYKADCPKGEVMVGVSVSPTYGTPHLIACCK